MSTPTAGLFWIVLQMILWMFIGEREYIDTRTCRTLAVIAGNPLISEQQAETCLRLKDVCHPIPYELYSRDCINEYLSCINISSRWNYYK